MNAFEPSSAPSMVLPGGSRRVLPAGGLAWRVLEGQVEVYLVSERRRRLVAMVAVHHHVFPLAAEGGISLVLVTEGPARLEASQQDLLPSARAWMEGHIEQESLPQSEEGLLATVQAFTASLDERFAAQDAERDRQTAERLALRDRPVALSPGLSAEIAWLARRMGVTVKGRGRSPTSSDTDVVGVLGREAGLRARAITLAPGWTHRDGGSLLLTVAGGGAARAAYWTGRRYRLSDGTEMTAGRASSFDRHAWEIHAPFPGAIEGFASLAGLALRGSIPELAITALAVCGLAVLGLLGPVATTWIFGDLIPSGATGLLWAAAAALVGGALFTTMLQAARALARSRLNGRGSIRLAAALTDHVLRLPVSFFRQIPAGDFNQRLESIDQMRVLVTSAILSATFTSAIALAYFGLMFAYEARLALIAVAMSLVYVVAVVVSRLLQRRPLREAAALDGRLAGLTYELLEGVPKLRSAAAEQRAMARWLRVYVDERIAKIRSEMVGSHFSAFAEGYRTFTLLGLFAGAVAMARPDLAPGPFIGFLASFTVFQATLSALCDDLLKLFAAQPLAERARPILMAAPEPDASRADPGTLTGRVEVSGLVFGYEAGSAPQIDGVSFALSPGEHVAIVGGSGSGKSTLLRLLLGFESPRAGSIAYDGQEITHLDLGRLRRQIGVVLQSSTLFAGTILENIRGASEATLEECLAAAENAGFGPDLKRMGMGVHTPITEGGGSFSGGQAQRILIARALASKPRLLFMDEATSALDNTTQAVVAQTLDELRVSRISIAHRLSTVRRADRICVLDLGRMVEMGTFDELMRLDGRFAALARRQLLE